MRSAKALGLRIGLLLALLVFAAPAVAQAPAAIPRVGFSLTGPASNLYLNAFRQGLRDLGYVEGKNIVVEVRAAEGRYERLPEIMREFVRMNVRVIVAGGGALAARAAREATSTIPIVSPAVADPLTSGLVTSLARPGGNFTGLSMQNTEISGKRLELLKAAVPRLGRVALLHQVGSDPGQVEATTAAARALGVQSHLIDVQSPAEFEAAFAEIRRQRADAVVVLASSVFNANRQTLIARMATSRLPAVWETPEFADAGGLMSYGPNLRDMYRRAATYVDRILKGARPGELPIEQPTTFELVINLKTAKALGLTIPDALVQRADRVIR
ncbi:MAG: ABC transporter substrate-binding protein [Candidatus Rokubacteria bacterium]|nr:ABC transporter substrate-binding protein [Candidatus Rokubacteria bacterium]